MTQPASFRAAFPEARQARKAGGGIVAALSRQLHSLVIPAHCPPQADAGRQIYFREQRFPAPVTAYHRVFPFVSVTLQHLSVPRFVVSQP